MNTDNLDAQEVWETARVKGKIEFARGLKKENEETPFTPEEKEIMDLLVSAHNKFCDLKTVGYFTAQDWNQKFHDLQSVLINEALIRRYPDHFNVAR